MNLKEIINHPNVTLLDVREEEELINEGQVPNAILIPMNKIPERIEEIKKFSTPVIIFCRSGNRSGKVIDYLSSQGISDLYNGGGFRDVNKLLENKLIN